MALVPVALTTDAVGAPVAETSGPYLPPIPHPHPPSALNTPRGSAYPNSPVPKLNLAEVSAAASTHLHKRLHKLDIQSMTSPVHNPVSSWPRQSHRPIEDKPAGSGAMTARPRPPFALELEAFIKRELRQLRMSFSSPSPLQCLPVYREILGVLTTHFKEYSETLCQIKGCYDAVVSDLMSDQRKVFHLATENRSLKEVYKVHVEEKEKAWEATVSALKKEIKARDAMIAQVRLEKDDERMKVMKLQQTVDLQQTELDDAVSRNVLMSSTIRDQAARQGSMSTQVKKLKGDNERLQARCAALETRIRNDELLGSNSPAGRRASMAQPMQPQQLLDGVKTPATTSPAPAKDLERLDESTHLDAGGAESGSGGGVRRKSLRDRMIKVVNTATARSTHFSADSGGDMPLDQFVSMEELREKIMELEGQNRRLVRANFTLQQESKQMAGRIAQLSKENNERPMTPKPDWSPMQRVLPKFDASALATTQETLEEVATLVAEQLSEEKKEMERVTQGNTIREWLGDEDLCESDLVGRGRFFVGLGTGPHVPPYLRYHGHIRNKKMQKGQVEKLLTKFWDERKDRHRAEDSLQLQPLAEFYYSWLMAETGNHHNSAIELAYQMLDVCERYKQDPDCGMFVSILQGRVSEAAFFDQLDIVERLESILKSIDKHNTNKIKRSHLNRILFRFFPSKGNDNMLKLRYALATAAKEGDIVHYNELFINDSEGNQSRFVELIRTQHVQEILEFVVDVEEALRAGMRNGKIMVGPAKTSIKELDPAMPNPEITQIVAFGAHCSVDQLEAFGEAHQVDGEEFLSRIRSGVLLKRFSRRTNDENMRMHEMLKESALQDPESEEEELAMDMAADAEVALEIEGETTDATVDWGQFGDDRTPSMLKITPMATPQPGFRLSVSMENPIVTDAPESRSSRRSSAVPQSRESEDAESVNGSKAAKGAGRRASRVAQPPSAPAPDAKAKRVRRKSVVAGGATKE